MYYTHSFQKTLWERLSGADKTKITGQKGDGIRPKCLSWNKL
jgi:hypothetical protein